MLVLISFQILRINHWQVAAESIRRHISDLNEYESWDSKDLDEDSNDADNLVPSNDTDSPCVKLGSRQAAETFESIEDAHKEDHAFTSFRVKLNEFLNSFLLAIQLPLPGGKQVKFRACDKVHYIQSNSVLLHWYGQTGYYWVLFFEGQLWVHGGLVTTHRLSSMQSQVLRYSAFWLCFHSDDRQGDIRSPALSVWMCSGRYYSLISSHSSVWCSHWHLAPKRQTPQLLSCLSKTPHTSWVFFSKVNHLWSLPHAGW